MRKNETYSYGLVAAMVLTSLTSFYLKHGNKRRALPSHYSMPSNYYQDILVLTIDD